MSSTVRVSCGLYKMLLFTYPGDFRLRFGSEMVSTFSDLICGEWEHHGLPGVARVWRSALGEVFSVAAPLQLQNSIVVAIYTVGSVSTPQPCSKCLGKLDHKTVSKEGFTPSSAP